MGEQRKIRIAVYGLAGAGFPLALRFSKHFPTTAYDHDKYRRRKARNDLADDSPLVIAEHVDHLSKANVFVIAVPTGVNEHHQPELRQLEEATKRVGSLVEGGELIIFASPLYPDATTERLIPLLEDHSGLKGGRDLAIGYCPPAMKRVADDPFANTTQVISGINNETMTRIKEIYTVAFPRGIHPTTTLQVAEAAYLIGSIQRDLNLALSNEIASICMTLGLDSKQVFEAAGVIGDRPPHYAKLVLDDRLVSDPYLLAHKAVQQGYHPELILAGRKINDAMPDYVVQRVTALMFKRRIEVGESRLLLLASSHKRSPIADRVYQQFTEKFAEYELVVDVFDPLQRIQPPNGELIAEPNELEYGLYHALVVLDDMSDMPQMRPERIRELGIPEAVLFDIAGALPSYVVDETI